MQINVKMMTLMLLVSQFAWGQQTLTLEQCRQMAVENSSELKQEKIRQEMAGYDKKIAASYYYPSISICGGYLHNGDNIALISAEQSMALNNIGTMAQQGKADFISSISKAIMSNPEAAGRYATDPLWQTVMGALQKADISKAVNEIGQSIDKALHLDIQNVGLGVVSLQQPIFAGGKIIESNRIARLAEELESCKYDEQYRQTIINVDNTYWQIVSIAAKNKLASDYCDLLQTMLKDVESSVSEGVSTQADALAVKVKANEASMMKTKAADGLKLAKMLLCKQTGLPLDSEIYLEDEGDDKVASPVVGAPKSIEEISQKRPELRQIKLAQQIFDKKVRLARAEMLPSVGLTANFLYSNPNLKNGFSNTWDNTWNVGVMLSIPIFHGTQALQKTRKAKAEAQLYSLKFDDACKMINLQVSQLHCQYDEALEKLQMAESDLDCAEENLRAAMLGYEEGVMPANTTMAAQTAWLKAHSECIDAAVELQMIALGINHAEGNDM